jgi:hypothetical protein
MTMPGFSADASLVPSSIRYRSRPMPGRSRQRGAIVPAMTSSCYWIDDRTYYCQFKGRFGRQTCVCIYNETCACAYHEEFDGYLDP